MVKYSERAHSTNFPIQFEALKVMVIRYVLYSQEKLPNVPIAGMYNKYGGKVRLTFKLELDQVWIGTKERTEKVPMGSIKNVVSEPIEGHDEYHMLAIQLGPTEASRYWIYWVPAQYVDAIKDTILGKWQPFQTVINTVSLLWCQLKYCIIQGFIVQQTGETFKAGPNMMSLD